MLSYYKIPSSALQNILQIPMLEKPHMPRKEPITQTVTQHSFSNSVWTVLVIHYPPFPNGGDMCLVTFWGPLGEAWQYIQE